MHGLPVVSPCGFPYGGVSVEDVAEVSCRVDDAVSPIADDIAARPAIHPRVDLVLLDRLGGRISVDERFTTLASLPNADSGASVSNDYSDSGVGQAAQELAPPLFATRDVVAG